MKERLTAFERYERGLVLKEVQIYDSALEEFQQAALDPQYAGKAHVQIALCLRSCGRYIEAVAAFREALKSATFSPKERLYVLYWLGQSLELLDRYPEALEVYGWIRREDPDFQDVTARITHLSFGGRGPYPSRQQSSRIWIRRVQALWNRSRPDLIRGMRQIRAWLQPSVKRLERNPRLAKSYAFIRESVHRLTDMVLGSREEHPPAVRLRTNGRDKRQHFRFAVRLRSQFLSKTWKVPGEGELRDISQWGCRVSSLVRVPVGTELECSIFPHNEKHPFTVDQATVRWSRPQEFGLAFTRVRPGVRQQIAQLCGQRAPLR